MAARKRQRPGVGSPDVANTTTAATTITTDSTAALGRRSAGIDRCAACGAAALGAEPVHAPWCVRVEPVRPVAVEVAI